MKGGVASTNALQVLFAPGRATYRGCYSDASGVLSFIFSSTRSREFGSKEIEYLDLFDPRRL